MHDNVHAFPLKKLRCAFPYVFHVGASSRDDVYRAKDPLAAGCVGVVMVMIVVVMRMAVRIPMGMRVRMSMPRMIVIMVMVVTVIMFRMRVNLSVPVAISMRMIMIMFGLCVLVGMHFSMRSTFVLDPELWYSIAHNASQGAQFLKRIPDAVLYICRQ